MLEGFVVWLVIGVVLITVEFLTGTMFLLVLGLAALASAAVAWSGFAFGIQVAVFAAAAAVAMVLVKRYRSARQPATMGALELGQQVSFEEWTDAPARLGRVWFRGSLWDARVEGVIRGDVGEVLYIRAVKGATLTVVSTAL